ncbi:MAG TPA: HAD family hydrolase [Pseudorhodoplanes sp.]|nr:HAD family hydrolase [Pseudorhodoplanes sp.]
MTLALPRPPAAIIFDFDGVILDSTPLKHQAFRRLYADEDPIKVEEMARYDRMHGGVTRRVKIAYFEKDLFGRSGDPASVEMLATRYRDLVFDAVMQCRFIPGARELLERAHGRIDMHLVSGTPLDELEVIVEGRGLGKYFKSLQGGPVLKPEAFANIMRKHGYEPTRTLAIGDALTEYDVANALGIPFLAIGVDGDHVFPDEAIRLPTLEGAAAMLGLD